VDAYLAATIDPAAAVIAGVNMHTVGVPSIAPAAMASISTVRYERIECFIIMTLDREIVKREGEKKRKF
jgi:hypothetical protein